MLGTGEVFPLLKQVTAAQELCWALVFPLTETSHSSGCFCHGHSDPPVCICLLPGCWCPHYCLGWKRDVITLCPKSLLLLSWLLKDTCLCHKIYLQQHQQAIHMTVALNLFLSFNKLWKWNLFITTLLFLLRSWIVRAVLQCLTPFPLTSSAFILYHLGVKSDTGYLMVRSGSQHC